MRRNNIRHHPASVRSLLAGPLFISEPYPFYRVLSAQSLRMLQYKDALEGYEYQ